MKRVLKWIGIAVAAVAALVVVAVIGGYLWLRTSLPQVDGSLTLAGLKDDVTIERDDRGVPTIRADNLDDAYFALGFVHAQDRLFQMDMMRHVGAGRLSEFVGALGVPTDKLMRTLGFYRLAQQQAAAAEPGLKAALDAYSGGVNAFLAEHSGTLPLEYHLLGVAPEPWQPADSLVWIRLMALQLSGNWRAERVNLALKKTLPPDLFNLLVPEASSLAGLPEPWFGRMNIASNNWVVAPSKSSDGAALLANDPHLGLGAPSIWYLAHLVTPQRSWVGVTSAGMPLFVIGANDSLAWGFTTTSGDTQDLFEERPVPNDPGRYQTPDGTAPFAIRNETIKVKGGADVALTVRSTRHGPVVSDLSAAPKPEDPILALSATMLLADDHTADALYDINMARTADEFRAALPRVVGPEQNAVFADKEGNIGFVAAGFIPVRKKPYMAGLLPAPGWTGDYDWTGFLPFDQWPQASNPAAGWLATANNKIVDEKYPHFIAAHWADDGRMRRIAELLAAKPTLGVEDFEAMQQDTLAEPLRDLIQSWLPRAKDGDPTAMKILAAWDGHSVRSRPEPLIATLWMARTAEMLLKDKLGENYDDWWYWDEKILQQLLADPKRCAPRSCEALLGASLNDAVAMLKKRLGDDPAKWQWGDLHRLHFANPILRNVPLLSTWLDPDLPVDGDMFTLNRATPNLVEDPLSFPDVHGPTMRLVVDMKDPMQARITLAGGQSGNPLSPNYADWLPDWRDGEYRTIVQPPVHRLTLTPEK